MSDLVRKELADTLELSGRYSTMLDRIALKLPATIADSENFHKSASQFKSVTLDVTDLTPVNAAKHLLAVITNTRHALEEAEINIRRKRLDLKRKKSELLSCKDELDRQGLIIDIDELECQIANTEASARGAIRKIHFSIGQYEQILEVLGVDSITEQMYEHDQSRYHVMTAFNQALTAARSRGGIIDEGNHIYFFQLGINGAVAQAEVSRLLEMERGMLDDGKEPPHQLIVDWLNHCADKFEDAGRDFAEKRGLTTLDYQSLVSGDEGSGGYIQDEPSGM